MSITGSVEVREGRVATVGSMGIVRALPTKGRRTVGPWCLVDLMVPGDERDPDPLEIGPHPHIGLSTVTWLFQGEAMHSDSLGTEQVIRPGQLNLMTAGNGIAHAELSGVSGVRGVQMWVAQPDATRHGPPAFEHHATLPEADLGSGSATVMIGSLAGAASAARADTEMIGVELRLRSGATVIEADPRFEYGVIPVDRSMLVNGAVVEPGWLGLVARGGSSLEIESVAGGRAMLIGGEPFEARVQMWWNFVARSREELTAAWSDWQRGDTDRFPEFASTLDRIDAPTPIWVKD